MGLIEFIFQNPLVILILIGALSSLFGKKKQEEQQQQRQRSKPQGRSIPQSQPVEMPWEHIELDPLDDEPVNHTKKNDEQTSGQGRDDQRTQRQIEWYEESMASSSQPEINQPSPTSDRYVERVQHSVVPIKSPIRPNAKQDQVRTPSTSGSGQRAMDFKNINGQNVVQGIIWSQVLGAPRSKEPHRSSVYRFGSRR